MPTKKPKPPSFESLGGTIKWTPKGLTVFIPQSVVSDWPAVEVFWDEEDEAVVIQCLDEEGES